MDKYNGKTDKHKQYLLQIDKNTEYNIVYNVYIYLCKKKSNLRIIDMKHKRNFHSLRKGKNGSTAPNTS